MLIKFKQQLTDGEKKVFELKMKSEIKSLKYLSWQCAPSEEEGAINMADSIMLSMLQDMSLKHSLLGF